MNIELIRQNLNACEAEQTSGDPQTAYSLAFQTARLLLSQAGAGLRQEGMDPQPLFIACVKAANVFPDLFTHLDASAAAEKLRQRARELSELFAQKQAELAELEHANRDLLNQEDALRQEEVRLKETLEKVRALAELKEHGLEALRQEVAEWEQKAHELEEACQAAQAAQVRLEAVLGENGSLIRDLPDSVGAANVDDLIGQAKTAQAARQEEAGQSEQVLAQILEALEQLYTAL